MGRFCRWKNEGERRINATYPLGLNNLPPRGVEQITSSNERSVSFGGDRLSKEQKKEYGQKRSLEIKKNSDQEG